MKFIHGHGGFGSYHAPQSKTPPKEIAETYRHARHVHHNKLESTRAERLGKVLGAEKAKVRTTRAGAGAIGTGAVVGGAVALKKSKKNDQ
jgi:hypothetical protein